MKSFFKICEIPIIVIYGAHNIALEQTIEQANKGNDYRPPGSKICLISLGGPPSLPYLEKNRTDAVNF